MTKGTKGYDFVIVGSGPNGLVAGVILASAGASVLIVESGDSPGGGCRSSELTLPGFLHDICSAIHPLCTVSPAFEEIGLSQLGLEYAFPEFAVAHPLPDGQVATLHRSLEITGASLGKDAESWRSLFGPLIHLPLLRSILKPVWWMSPNLFWTKARFGLAALRSCESLIQSRFTTPLAKALFAGCAAHSTVPLDRTGTASFGLVLAITAHLTGWPCIRGGSREIAQALLREFRSRGGELELGRHVTTLNDLPPHKAVLFDINPAQLANICGEALPQGFRNKLLRFKRGPGTFKVDWALDGPIPWTNPECLRAATVHVGSTFEEIRQAEAEANAGVAPQKPFVLAAQQSLFDASRAPAGKHTGWAYCHVPNGCTEDMADRIEAQIERFAPGFRQRILRRHTISPLQLEAHNPAMVGGDIGGGANDLIQFLFRPVFRWNPYTTPNPRIFLCSSSTPPGGGVHGMCGYFAARSALRSVGLGVTRRDSH